MHFRRQRQWEALDSAVGGLGCFFESEGIWEGDGKWSAMLYMRLCHRVVLVTARSTFERGTRGSAGWGSEGSVIRQPPLSLPKLHNEKLLPTQPFPISGIRSPLVRDISPPL